MANPYEQFADPAAAGTPPAPTEPQAPAADSAALTLGDRGIDIARAGVGALRDAVQGIVQAPLALGEFLSPITDKVTGGNPEVTKAAFKAVRSKLSFSEVEEQQTVAGSVIRSVGKWVTLGALLPGQTAVTATGAIAGRLAVGAGTNAVQGLIGTSENERGLANLVQDNPSLQNPITEFLATNENDSEAVKKLKGAFENVVTGGAVESLIIGVKAARSARALATAGKLDEAKAVEAEALAKMQQKHAKGATEGVDVSIFPDNAGIYEDSATSIAKATAEAEAKAADLVTVYRHGAPKGASSFFGETEGGVSQFADAGPLHSMSVSKADLEKYRASNILKDPNADPALVAEAKLAGMPDNEFVFPKSTAKSATEHYPKLEVQAATTRVADKDAVLEEFKVNRSRGEDGVTQPLEGNINYTKYGSDEGVKQLMSTVVKTVKNDLPDLMGSYQSQRETADLARLMGKDPTDLYTSLAATRHSTEDLAVQVVAGKALIKRVATDLYTVAEKLKNGLGTDVDKVAFAHMTDVLASTMDHVASIVTSAARTTAAGRMRVGMQGITKENFAKLLEQVGGSDAVMALARRVAAAGDEAGVVAAVKGTPGKFMAIHNFIWMNGVLGGLKTGVVNLTTTAFNSAIMPGTRILGGLADMALTGNGKDEVLKGMYQYKMMSGTWRTSWQMAKKAFAQGESILDPSSNPLGQLKGNLLSQDFTGIENEAMGRGIEYLGKIIGLPSKFLIMEDEFFKQTIYRSHVGAQAYVDGLKQGLDGIKLQEFVDGRLAASIGDMGRGLDDAGMLAAKAATFTQDLAAETLRGNRTLSEGIAGFSNAHPAVKGLILPFVKVPVNLMRQVWDMTPGLNLMRTQYMADLNAGGEARAMALGKMGLGGAMWGTAVSLGMNGRITGAGPRDKDLRRQLGPDWKPYSFVFNNDDGTKTYLSFARFDPFGMFFGLAADAAEVGGKLKQAEYGEAAGKMVLGLVSNLASKTYLRAMTDVLEAATGDERQFKRWTQSRLASYVPGYAQLLNTDDELKDIRGWFDGLISRVPGWSQTLEAKRDNFGEKVMPPMGHPYTAFNPFTFYRSTDDPVRKELASLAKDDIEAKFPLPTPTFGPKGQEVDLREIKNAEGQSAYDRWMELHNKMEVGGKTLHESMGQLFASDTYKKYRELLGTGDPTYKASLATDLVRKQFDMYEKITYQQLIREFPDLGRSAQQFKVGQKTSRVRGSGTAPNIQQLRELAGQQ